MSNVVHKNITGFCYSAISDCDEDVYIKATEKYTIFSENYPHSYLPKLHCNFRFQTDADFWLLVLTHDVDIGGEQMCDETFIEVENLGKFCADAQPPSGIVIRKPSVNMVFKTSEEVYGKGINITVVSVGQNFFLYCFMIKFVYNITIKKTFKKDQKEQTQFSNYKHSFKIPGCSYLI